MLGSMLGLPGFDYGSIDAIRAESMTGGDIASRLANATNVPLETPAAPNGAALERIADVPLYFADPLVRRAVSLQKTRDARPPMARVNPSTLAQLKLAEGAAVRVRQDGGEAMLTVAVDRSVPDGCMRIATAHATTSGLGAMFGPIAVESA